MIKNHGIQYLFSQVFHIADYYPIHESPCYCESKNDTLNELYGTSEDFVGYNATKPHKYPCEFEVTHVKKVCI